MPSERWAQIERIFHAARERDAASRASFLAEACAGDPALQSEVQSLLSHTADLPDTVPETLTAELDSPPLGTLLGRYRIEEKLGKGGMGAVYRAVDTRLGRKVAIKVSQSRFSHRFEREAQIIAKLNHPHVCTLYDVGPNFLVMELLEGETLAARLTRGALSPEEVSRYPSQIADALAEAHAHGIVHRDLKPANIMLTRAGAKVVDFGIARRVDTDSNLTAPHVIVGTLAYMAPEQREGKPVDARADLYALGLILYEMATGRRPGLDAAPALEGLPDPLPHVVARCLAPDPDARWQSAAELKAALQFSPTDDRPLRRLAVLPFVFLSDVEERQSMALGFADSLITTLGSLPDLAVLPTSAILNYSHQATPAAACRELGVRYTLQGTVQKRGDQWRVSMQLFDGSSQTIVMAEKHDFQLQDVFDVQDEIARRVGDSLQTRFSPQVPRARDRYSSNPAAYDAFLSGLRDSYSDRRDKKESALRHLSQAVALDPDFALAHATLSHMYADLHYNFDPQAEWIQRAEQHCGRALSLDRSLPEGHMAKAWILWSPSKNFQHVEAILALEQALELQPNLERAHNRMSSICWHIGRIAEGLKAHELAQQCNPRTVSSNRTSCYYHGGEYIKAEESTYDWLARSPDNMFALRYQALCAMARGDLDLTGQRLEEVRQRLSGDPLFISLEGTLFALRSQRERALECVSRALELPRSFGHTHHTYHEIARIYTLLGDHDKGLAWLERTADTGFPCWSFFRIDPHLQPLRGLAGFETLLQQLEARCMAINIHRL